MLHVDIQRVIAAGIVDIADNDLRARARQSLGAGGTDARCGAGDNSDLALYLSHHLAPERWVNDSVIAE